MAVITVDSTGAVIPEIVVGDSNAAGIEIDISDFLLVTDPEARIVGTIEYSEDGRAWQTFCTIDHPYGRLDHNGQPATKIWQRWGDRQEGVYSLDGGLTWASFIGVAPARVQQILATEGVKQATRQVPFKAMKFRGSLRLSKRPVGVRKMFDATVTGRI